MDSIIRPVQDNRRDVLWFLPFLSFVVGYLSLGAIQKRAKRRYERAAFYVLVLASVAVALGQLGIVLEIPALQRLGFPGGAIVWMLGQIAYGVATWRVHLFPRYVALALILWEPGSILTGVLLAPISPLRDRGAYSAGLEKGVGTLFLGIGLWIYSRRSAANLS